MQRILARATALAMVTGVAMSALAETPSLAPPAGTRLILRAIADGVQIYACQSNDKGYGWVFKAPEANLFDEGGRQIGKHFAGPSWQALDGSVVTGEVAARADAPGANAIPWLLLRATSHAGAGQLANAGFIQRLDTKGGAAPSAACDATQQGIEARIPYSATYVFYAAAP
jgi:hypothetical protein